MVRKRKSKIPSIDAKTTQQISRVTFEDEYLKLSRSRSYLKDINRSLIIFHNITDSKCYVTYSNGIKTPVRFNPDILDKPKGVYIITVYKFPYVMHTDIAGLEKYYTSENGLDVEYLKIIKEFYNSKTHTENNDDFKHVVFIPYEEIAITDNVRVDDVMISMNNSTVHYPKEKTFTPMDTIAIRIYENTDSSYFFKLFNNIIEIIPITTDKHDRCVITVNVSNVKKNIVIHIDKLKSHGIHRTRIDAEVSGDFETHLKLMKFEKELAMMQLEYDMKTIDLIKTIELGNLKVEEKKYVIEALKQKAIIENIKEESEKRSSKTKDLITIGSILGVVANSVKKIL
jgi:hypothetical protein